jgi:hypothetical protein
VSELLLAPKLLRAWEESGERGERGERGEHGELGGVEGALRFAEEGLLMY